MSVAGREGPEKFVTKQGGGLKPACSQDWLPHQNAKPQRDMRNLRQAD
jgi:hypothetical protein